MLEPAKMNVAQKPLVGPQKILLQPLRVKHGIIKTFVKAMDNNKKVFVSWKENSLSLVKLISR